MDQVASASLDLEALDKELLHKPYLGGFVTPDSRDCATFRAIDQARLDPEKHPSVVRWAKHLGSFSQEDLDRFSSAMTLSEANGDGGGGGGGAGCTLSVAEKKALITRNLQVPKRFFSKS